MGCDTAYDFDLQEIKPFAEEVKVYPTDKLTTHCVYDSTDRTTITPGGDETTNEMCINLMLYYPEDPEHTTMQCWGTPEARDTPPTEPHICKLPGETGAPAEDLCVTGTGTTSAATTGSCADNDAELFAPCRQVAADHPCTCETLQSECMVLIDLP
jgi:hypothetical protein